MPSSTNYKDDISGQCCRNRLWNEIGGAMSKEDFYRVLKKGICTHSVLEGKGKDQTNIIAGVIEDDFEIIRERNYKRYPRSTRMALAAAADAVEMSNLLCDPHRVAIIIGTSAGAIL